MSTSTARTPDSILYEEHAAIERVLGYLDRALDLLGQGTSVSPDLFRDLLEFARSFVATCHHGKEEQILFPALRSTGRQAQALIADLEHDHEQGVTLTNALAAAIDGCAERGMPAAGALIAAGRAYADYLRLHMRRENDRLLPWTRQISPGTQVELVAAFDRFEEDVMGAGTHERLHRMIGTLGPRLEAALA